MNIIEVENIFKIFKVSNKQMKHDNLKSRDVKTVNDDKDARRKFDFLTGEVKLDECFKTSYLSDIVVSYMK